MWLTWNWPWGPRSGATEVSLMTIKTLMDRPHGGLIRVRAWHISRQICVKFLVTHIHTHSTSISGPTWSDSIRHISTHKLIVRIFLKQNGEVATILSTKLQPWNQLWQVLKHRRYHLEGWYFVSGHTLEQQFKTIGLTHMQLRLELLCSWNCCLKRPKGAGALFETDEIQTWPMRKIIRKRISSFSSVTSNSWEQEQQIWQLIWKRDHWKMFF